MKLSETHKIKIPINFNQLKTLCLLKNHKIFKKNFKNIHHIFINNNRPLLKYNNKINNNSITLPDFNQPKN
jgi:hypothetical protein